MSNNRPYSDKFTNISQKTSFLSLPDEQQSFIKGLAFNRKFTMQELRQIVEITQDLNNWGESNIKEIWSQLDNGDRAGRDGKKYLLHQLTNRWQQFKLEPNRYHHTQQPAAESPVILTAPKEQIALGYCPVASEKTRCCNLLTLDAVENCGFDCSYCSIQSFYHGNQVIFDQGFAGKLLNLELDQDKIYHIGTGQSSDSLMWGNKHGVLDALIEFANANHNVILEMKTKSANIGYLSKTSIPPNVICTWSLNTQVIIDNEEHQTASLPRRLKAARKIADMGTLVGFHFHPMIHYKGWRNDYSLLYKQVQEMFDPSEVAMVSIGTLTFIKPVIKKIRERDFHSMILKMPMVETAGKISYPPDVKLELFSHAYNSFSQQWHDDVFFYLCMEGHELWKQVFGFEYQSNEEFELAMKSNYLQKIHAHMHHK